MAYTSAQLVAAYTAANNGVAPDAATTALLNAFAAQTQTGQLSDAAALSYVINSAQDDVAVALQSYQFFTGKTPTSAGLDYLTNSAANPNDLNDPFYAQFNLENRYINFAANLGVAGEGATAFNTTYGSLSFAQFVDVIYETIIGSSYATAAGINVAAAKADIAARQANFVAIATERGLINASSTAAQRDIAVKAAVTGYLMAEGIKADVGLYAAGANNFIAAMVNGTEVYNGSLATYAAQGGGLGSPVPGGAANPGGPGTGTTYTLTAGPDAIAGTSGNDTVNGVLYTNATAPFISTFNVTDTISGGTAGTDVLNLVVADAGAAATGNVSLPAVSVSSIETVNVRALSSTAANVVTVNAANFSGHQSINSDRSISAVTVANMAAGTSAGIIGDGSVTNGALTFGYATGTSAATLNLSGGTRGATVTVNTSAPAVTVNSTGTVANSLGGLALGGSASSLTVNATSDFTTTGVTGFAAGGTITVTGNATAVTLGALENTVASVNASGLTAGGVSTTIGARAGTTFTGGNGADTVTVANGSVANITGAINGGAGTDVIAFSGGSDLTAATAARISNFETLRVSNGGAAGTTETFDPTLLTGITSYQVGTSTGAVQLNNLAAAPTVTVLGNVTGTAGLALRLKDASGANDQATVVLSNSNTATPNTSGVSISTLSLGGNGTAGQVETLNIVSAGNVTGTGAFNSVTLASSGVAPFADPNVVKVTGSQGLTLTTGTLAHALTVDASAATGGLAFDSTAGAAAFAVNVNGTTANDNITVASTQSGVIYAGGGGDRIVLAGEAAAAGTASQTVTYKAGTDSVFDLAALTTVGTGTNGQGVNTQTARMDSIANFTSGVDKINLTDIAGFNSPQVIADKGSALAAADISALLGSATFFQDSTNTLRKVAQFDVTGGTVVVADVNGNGTYDGGDLAVLLVGVTNVANGDLIGS